MDISSLISSKLRYIYPNNSLSEFARMPFNICFIHLLKKLLIMFSHEVCVDVNTNIKQLSGNVARKNRNFYESGWPVLSPFRLEDQCIRAATAFQAAHIHNPGGHNSHALCWIMIRKFVCYSLDARSFIEWNRIC